MEENNMSNAEENNLIEIQLTGSNSQGVFTVHKKIPEKIRREIGEEMRFHSTFLDRSKEEKGLVTLFSKNSFLMKEVIEDEEQYKKILLMEDKSLGELEG